MTAAVLDASAVLALIRNEPGADIVAAYAGRAVLSAVNLHEVAKELMIDGLNEDVVRELIGELRLDVRAHDAEAAYRGAALNAQTRRFGRGLGDRSCLALAFELGIPAVTADREWQKLEIEGLRIEQIR